MQVRDNREKFVADFHLTSPKQTTMKIKICSLALVLLLAVMNIRAQSVETGIVKLADSNIEYFSRGKVKQSGIAARWNAD